MFVTSYDLSELVIAKVVLIPNNNNSNDDDE